MTMRGKASASFFSFSFPLRLFLFWVRESLYFWFHPWDQGQERERDSSGGERTATRFSKDFFSCAVLFQGKSNKFAWQAGGPLPASKGERGENLNFATRASRSSSSSLNENLAAKHAFLSVFEPLSVALWPRSERKRKRECTCIKTAHTAFAWQCYVKLSE